MSQKTKKGGGTLRQRYCLIFGINFSKKRLNFGDKLELIYDNLMRIPWTCVPKADKNKIWTWNDISKGKPSFEDLWPCFNLADSEIGCERGHKLLDELPQSNTFLLDTIVIVDEIPTGSSAASLYGLLRRSADWHGAGLKIIVLDNDITQKPENPFDIGIKILTAEEDLSQDTDVFWRGDLSFFDDQSRKFFDLSGFELSAVSNLSLDLLEKSVLKNVRFLSSATSGHVTGSLNKIIFSRRLKVVSQCSTTSIPKHFITEAKFNVRSMYNSRCREEVEAIDALLSKPSLKLGLLARLDSCQLKATSSFMEVVSTGSDSSKKKLSTEFWKRWTRNGMHQDENPEKDFCMENKSVDPLFFLLHQPTKCESKIDWKCVMLNPDVENVTRHSSTIYDVMCSEKKSDVLYQTQLPTINYQVNMESLQKAVEFVRQKVVESLDEDLLQMKKEDLRKLILHKCIEILKIQNHPENLSKFLNSTEPMTTLIAADDESEWEERRFVNLLSHSRNNQTRTSSNIMTTSGEFVVMEAKELVKLFESDGSAKKGTVLQPLPTLNSKMVLPEVDIEKTLKNTDLNFHQIAILNYHDVYFNRDDHCEIRDQELSRAQQIYVGLKETVSTCCSQNTTKESEVIAKLPPNSISTDSSQKETVPLLPSVVGKTVGSNKTINVTSLKSRPRFTTGSAIRKSPRKLPSQPKTQMAPPKMASASRPLRAQTPEEIFRQKLRNAVYVALEKKGITEKKTLFRPCFKRLFDICCTSTKGLPEKVKYGTGVNQMLQNMAQQNVDLTITIEKQLIDEC